MSTPATQPSRPEPLLPGSAESYMVSDVPVCGPATSVGELQQMLVGGRYGSAADVAVCAEGAPMPRLLGLIPLEAVLAAAPDTLAGDLMGSRALKSLLAWHGELKGDEPRAPVALEVSR